ncbi:ornithine decarboxylase antizyme [Histoplasma capsulatum G186AR]|uniref:Ornithine decarboxylase antizyme n=1 Tax=Ajellomyces capsulatus TaxID=5037 RepID=A0A8H7Z7R6_AJECA|nr:ornithine decarboxylase antizyme [Histoplasma capsulatum]QSS71809.1 ornithine decarboxylase antizyme [Histoplasma capsulatum G186AR]
MPTELHDAHQRWAIDALVEWTQDGLLSREEQRALDAGVGTTFDGFTGVYQGSYKEPDFFFRADNDDFPSIVMESGWSESLPYLRADKDLWIKGNDFVQLVILLKWHNVSGGRVKGSAEIWRRNGTGNLATTEMTIFPVPNTPVINEHIEFTKGQLFGAAAIGCPDAGTMLSLRISRLREIAKERLVKNMGLMPA